MTAVNLMLRQARRYCTDAPLILPRELKLRNTDIFNQEITPIKESWLYNFETLSAGKVGLVQLHPKIFSAFPRPDLLHRNILWQNNYRKCDWLTMKTKAEFRTLNAKPWPQKGTGRARHGNKRTAQFVTTGGWAHGPRGPKTSYYMVSYWNRVYGLISAATAKFAQNDLKIVDTLANFPSDDPKFLTEMLEARGWGPTALICDNTDIFPKNIALAAHGIGHVNVIPLFGLNVLAMLKHETLIMTYSALREFEDKILFAFNRTDIRNVAAPYEAQKVVPNYPNTDPELQP